MNRLTPGPGIPVDLQVNPAEWIEPLLLLFSDSAFQLYHDESYLINALAGLLSPRQFVTMVDELRARCPLSAEHLQSLPQTNSTVWNDFALWQCDVHMMAARANLQGFIRHLVNRVRVFLETDGALVKNQQNQVDTASEQLYLRLLQYLSFPYIRADASDSTTWYVFAPYPMAQERPSALIREPRQYVLNDEVRSWITVTNAEDMAYHLYAPVTQILREVANSYKNDYDTAPRDQKDLLMTFHIRANTMAHRCEKRVTDISITRYRAFCHTVTYSAAYPRNLIAFSNGVYDLQQQRYRGYLPSDCVMKSLYAFRTIQQLSPDFTPNRPHLETLETLFAFYRRLWPDAAQRAAMLRRLSSFVLAPFRTRQRCCAILGGRYNLAHQALVTLIRSALEHYIEEIPINTIESPLSGDFNTIGQNSRFVFTTSLGNPVIWENLWRITDSKAVLIAVHQATTTAEDISNARRFCYYNRRAVTGADSQKICFHLIDAPQDIRTPLPTNDILRMLAPYFMCSMIDLPQILDMM